MIFKNKARCSTYPLSTQVHGQGHIPTVAIDALLRAAEYGLAGEKNTRCLVISNQKMIFTVILIY